MFGVKRVSCCVVVGFVRVLMGNILNGLREISI